MPEELFRRGGYMELTIDGTTYECTGAFNSRISGDKRESLNGPASTHGYKTSFMPGMVTGAIRDNKRIPIRKIIDMTDGTVVIALANGKRHLHEHAYYTGDRDLESEEGKITFACESLSSEEIS